ncbi:MAG: LacI family DNA-binding transcriptional regulator [Blautia wexlerae]
MESGRQKVTRKDVAREAGVSETIVSYVLNKNRYVKEEKRQRVLEVVEKLQYHPNNIARALHGKGSLQILFIAEELSSGYFSELVSQMSRDAYRRGYMISLVRARRKMSFVSQILSRQFDGLFVSASGVTDRELKLLVKSGIPMVLFLNREISCDLRDTVGGRYRAL